MTEPSWPEDLLKEKSLWEIFKISQKFPANKSDNKLRLFASIMMPAAIGSAFAFRLSNSQSIDFVTTLSSSIMAFSTTVIGFLVTGFVVFITLSERRIWIELAKTPMKDKGVSSFKYLFFNLLSVFQIYIFGVALAMLFFALASLKIAVNDFNVCGYVYHTAQIANIIATSFLGMMFTELLIRLKSFVWNLYSTFISVLTVSSLLDGADKK